MKKILNKTILITLFIFSGAGWYYLGSRDHIVKIILSEQISQSASSTSIKLKTATSSPPNVFQNPAPKTTVS